MSTVTHVDMIAYVESAAPAFSGFIRFCIWPSPMATTW